MRRGGGQWALLTLLHTWKDRSHELTENLPFVKFGVFRGYNSGFRDGCSRFPGIVILPPWDAMGGFELVQDFQQLLPHEIRLRETQRVAPIEAVIAMNGRTTENQRTGHFSE